MQGWGGSCKDRVGDVGVGGVDHAGVGHAGVGWGESRHTTGYQI